MPRLRLVERKIAGEYFRLDLWYDTRGKSFTIKGLPQRFLDLTKFGAHALTEAALEKELDESIDAYHAAIQTETQVIAVSFKVARNSYSKEVWRSDGWGTQWKDDPSFPAKFAK